MKIHTQTALKKIYNYCTKNSKYITVLLCYAALLLLKPFKISMLFGSSHRALRFLRLHHTVTPVLGFFSSAGPLVFLWATRIVFKGLTSTGSLAACALTGLPTTIGMLYLTTENRYIRIALPAIAILLFVLHPTGQQAWLYSLYWLIPLGISIVNPRSIFAQSLASTFVTHSIGSVIWLYAGLVEPSMWHQLIGIVWTERLVSALMMTGCYYTVQLIAFLAEKVSDSVNWYTRPSKGSS